MNTKTYLNHDQTTLIRWNPVCMLDIETIVSTRTLSRVEFIYACNYHIILLTLFRVEVNAVFFQCHHMSLTDIVVSPPSCGRSVTDFWGWDAYEAQLRCPDEVDSDVWIWSTKLPRPWSPWESSHQGKIPMVEPGIEPRTSWSVVRNSDK
jgi:hypothetical protein